jgi:hypothetical protein
LGVQRKRPNTHPPFILTKDTLAFLGLTLEDMVSAKTIIMTKTLVIVKVLAVVPIHSAINWIIPQFKNIPAPESAEPES